MNPSHGWTDYQARMDRVTAYIHEHLADPLDLATLAEVACLSPFHWHRVYQALNGESITASVRRLRLHRASGYLANSAMPVAQIATLCGYPQTTSFARAFASVYGRSPTAYRREGLHVLFRQGGAPVQAAGYAVEVRWVDAVRLAGVAHRGSYMRLGQPFAKAYSQLSGHGLVGPDSRWMAVYDDDPFAVPESQLHSRVGLSLPSEAAPPPPLQCFTLGGGPCAVLRYQGPYASMRAAYQWLYGQWLVQSGHAVGDVPVFEEYLNHPRDTAPADLLTDIYLPLAASTCVDSFPINSVSGHGPV